MKKNSNGIVFLASLATIVSLSSCTVEYRERHPRPKRVVVVGQVTVPKEIKDENNTYVVHPVNKASDGITK